MFNIDKIESKEITDKGLRDNFGSFIDSFRNGNISCVVFLLASEMAFSLRNYVYIRAGKSLLCKRANMEYIMPYLNDSPYAQRWMSIFLP